MSTFTNKEVQTELGIAVQNLDRVLEDSKGKASDKVVLAKLVLTMFKDYSASGNSIPGLSGLGLKEVMALANEINQNGTRNLTLNTTALSKSIGY